MRHGAAIIGKSQVFFIALLIWGGMMHSELRLFETRHAPPVTAHAPPDAAYIDFESPSPTCFAAVREPRSSVYIREFIKELWAYA